MIKKICIKIFYRFFFFDYYHQIISYINSLYTSINEEVTQTHKPDYDFFFVSHPIFMASRTRNFNNLFYSLQH